MRIVRAGIVSAAIWLLVVAAGSSFAWVAINQAGENLVAVDIQAVDDAPDPAAGPLPILPAGVSAAPSTPRPSGSQTRVSGAARTPQASPSSPVGGTQTAPGGTQASPTAPVRPATPKPTTAKPTTTDRPTTGRPHGTPSSPHRATPPPSGQTAGTPTATSPPAVRTPAVTASGGAGVVTVACQSGVVRVRSVTPRSEWTARVYRRESIAAVSFHREGRSTGFVLFVGCVGNGPRIVSTPRGVTVEPRAIREVLDDHTFGQIANRLDWRPAFSNGDS